MTTSNFLLRSALNASFSPPMKTVKTTAHLIEAGPLDAVRGGKLLTLLGIKGAELSDSTPGLLVYTVPTFMGCVAPLTKFYGSAKNTSDAGWAQKRLVWNIPEVNGEVMLLQVGNLKPLIIFKQL